jgi:hypothetical protein
METITYRIAGERANSHLTYDEVASGEYEPIAITFDRALSLTREHNCSAVEMLTELGNAPSYDARQVLVWLGY